MEEFYTPGQMQEKIEQYWMRHVGRKPENLGELASGVYLGLAFKYRFTIEKLEEYTGKHFRSVNIVGGGAKSSLLCRKIADVCGLPVEAGPFDATAYGNVLIQMIAKGVISSVEEGRRMIRNSCEIRRYEPSGTGEWENKYREFKKQMSKSNLP